jgi:hypothetical protein
MFPLSFMKTDKFDEQHYLIPKAIGERKISKD